MFIDLKEILTGNCLSDFTEHINLVYKGRITFDEFNENEISMKPSILLDFFDSHDILINTQSEDWNLDIEERFLIQLKKVNKIYNENRNNNMQH